MELFNGRLYPNECIPYLQQFNKERYEEELRYVIDLTIEKIKDNIMHAIYTCCIATNIYKLDTTVSLDNLETSEKYRQLLFSSMEKRYQLKKQKGKLTKRDRLPDINNNGLFRNYDEPDKYAFPNVASVKNDSMPKNFEFHTQRKCWNEIFPLQKNILQYAAERMMQLPNLHPDFEIFFIGMESKKGFLYRKEK